jgi:hypothetical protein
MWAATRASIAVKFAAVAHPNRIQRCRDRATVQPGPAEEEWHHDDVAERRNLAPHIQVVNDEAW